MESLKRIYKFFLCLIFLFIILFVSTYSVFILKPQLFIKISNLSGAADHSIYYESLESSNKFFFPEYDFNNLEIKNNKTNQIIKISNFKIGINIIKTLKKDFFSFNVLEIKNISIEGRREYKETDFSFIKLQANDLKIENLDFTFHSLNTHLIYKNGSTSVYSEEGKVNGMIFEEINFFLPLSSKKNILCWTVLF